mmetsp:Transcript_17553/g.34274  ORF Transcript_17553/g.34274 Transcript_17553/m.34274 type:complete len:616 (+) Transcript_17553:30-1877(+)
MVFEKELVTNVTDKDKKKSKKKKKKSPPESVETVSSSMTASTTDEVKKKKTKQKDKVVVATSNEPQEVYNAARAAYEANKSDKSLKKAAKAAKKVLAAYNAELTAKAEAKAAKKAAKKAKKRKAEGTPVEHAEPAVASESAPTSKKLKSQGSAASSSSADGFYSEHPDITTMSESDVKAYRNELMVSVSGKDCNIRPIKKFSQSSLPAPLVKFCDKFEKPSPIQAQAWPALLMGRDVIGIAKTGSGKTLAFMFPAMVRMIHQCKSKPINSKNPGPLTLVLAPTRELALQTAKVCDELEQTTQVRSACIYGGVDKNPQVQALRQGLHVVIATPGRLLGLIREGKCSLAQVNYLVLDEADRMLDMGFEPDIRAIVGQIGSNRQTLLFSATWPESIRKLGAEFVKNPFHITVGSEDLTANHAIEQIVEVLDDDRPFVKDKKLLTLMSQYHTGKNRILVFVLYKKDVGRVENLLAKAGLKVTSISSDRSQADRTKALAAFKDGSKPVLVGTDVAARGLDIPNVSHVINYSFPLTIEDYIHRIGRTGRGGKTGVSHTFFTKFDKSLSGELYNILQEANAQVPPALLKFGTGVKKKAHGMYGAFGPRDSNRPMQAAKKVKL